MLELSGTLINYRNLKTKKGNDFQMLEFLVPRVDGGQVVVRAYNYVGNRDWPVGKEAKIPVWVSAYVMGDKAYVKINVEEQNGGGKRNGGPNV